MADPERAHCPRSSSGRAKLLLSHGAHSSPAVCEMPPPAAEGGPRRGTAAPISALRLSHPNNPRRNVSTTRSRSPRTSLAISNATPTFIATRCVYIAPSQFFRKNAGSNESTRGIHPGRAPPRRRLVPAGLDSTTSQRSPSGMIYTAPKKVAANPKNSGSRNQARFDYAGCAQNSASSVGELPHSAAEGRVRRRVKAAQPSGIWSTPCCFPSRLRFRPDWLRF
jgi:hypothetical protein